MPNHRSFDCHLRVLAEVIWERLIASMAKAKRPLQGPFHNGDESRCLLLRPEEMRLLYPYCRGAVAGAFGFAGVRVVSVPRWAFGLSRNVGALLSCSFVIDSTIRFGTPSSA